MLTQLNVRHLKLMKNAGVSFQQGLNVITGESGAGKSMLISALKLILGEKADTDIISHNESQTTIEAVFDVTRLPELIAFLATADIACDHGELIIRRHIQRQGRSQIYINDTVVTVKYLKQIGDMLIDMHGQHSHQSLLQEQQHLVLLDNLLNLGAELKDYQESYAHFTHLHKQWHEATDAVQHQSQEWDFWNYQLKELNALQLEAGEMDRLKDERHALRHREEYGRLLAQSLGLLSDEGGVEDKLHEISYGMDRLVAIQPDLEALLTNFKNAIVQIQDVARELARHHSGEDDLSPQRLEEIEQRLFTLENAQRKYHKTFEQLVAYRQELSDKIMSYENRDATMADLQQKYDKARTEAIALAANLSQKRRKKSVAIIEQVSKELQSLGMPHAQFDIEFLTSDLAARGTDKVRFLIRTNKGGASRPLADIASGGEISRVMLALKTVFAHNDNIPTLIFDEIDANLGGETARRVGEKLQSLSQHKQIICITHLPQIASLAQTHILVKKAEQNKHAESHAHIINDQERILELARMLGGDATARVAQQHAKELLNQH